MSRPYGKIPRGRSNSKSVVSAEIQINIVGRHTLEQISLELQRGIARLQEYGVYGAQKWRMRLEPLDEKGEPVALWNDAGNPVTIISVPEPPFEPAYRKD